MHLKRLEAFGFKSFADKVIFDFQPGVTCFAGPNGCGKSNVVDAVRWVLGEQSAKSLRGTEMLDVIFNGSARRKALNFAEVTLVFDNASGQLPLNAPEVSVSRRLYRSGESEYLINKALCRLRDVRELFWDTGIGTSSYSVIEQGRISALLEANSKDRRILFEEAAGIHKYKERKRIALRKLERVEQNLARLADLLGEVDRNLRSVTRQAEKARKAKEISTQLRQCKLDLLLHDTSAAEAALREAGSALSLATQHVSQIGERLARAQAVTAEQQEILAQLDAQYNEVQGTLAEARAKLQRLEAEIEGAKRDVAELAAEAQRAETTAKAAGERAAALASERERVELDAAKAVENLAERTAQVATLSEKAAQEQAAREALLQPLESARRNALDTLSRRTLLQDSFTHSEAELASLEYRLRRVEAQLSRAADQLKFARGETEQLRARMAENRQRREMLAQEQQALQAEQQQAEAESQKLISAGQELQRELENRRSRLAALEGLRESGEGLNPGAHAVLATLRHELKVAAEVHGLVADCLNVEPRLERAVEAALGVHLETIVVGFTRTAELLGARLSEQELGRATFLPLDHAEAVWYSRAAENSRPAGSALPGCLGVAADLIACEEKFRPLARLLLGRVLIFDTAAHAAESFRLDNGSSGWARASLDGGFYACDGSVCGGRFKAQHLGLIGRKNEIERLGSELEGLRVRIETVAEETAVLEQRAQKAARAEERLAAEIDALDLNHTELKGVLNASERDEARGAEEQNLAERELREMETERGAQQARVQGLRGEVEAARKAEEEAAACVQRQEADLARCDTALAAARKQLAEAERDAAAWRERASALQRETQSLSAQFAERRDEADREQKRQQNLLERRTATLTLLTEKNKGRAELADLDEALSMRAEGLQEQKELARRVLEEARGRERECAAEQERAREELSQAREREMELRLRLENKVEQGRGEFQLDLRQELAARGTVPQPPPEAQEQIRQLEERLARLGPVSLYALDELEELQQRHAFLKTQSEDLQSARMSLRDVIARINRRSRTLFQETFESVKGQFNEMFRKIFGGGKADLLLEEGEDILEAGIEIIARPPGKELRNVSLLSGGEKTMTMIALLFAVFRSRPAPFCILDEVDAPLDEANVERFNLIVKEFLDRSQFVVITHNKKTMSHANVIYGITMPEPGVSKRIALKFEEIEKHLPLAEMSRDAEEARRKNLAQGGIAPAEVVAEPAAAPVAAADSSDPADKVAAELAVESKLQPA
jgi:chromosome segregation protein